MLVKERMTSGVKVRVNETIKDGLGGTLQHIRVFTGMVGMGPAILIPSSIELEIVKKPRRSDGINLIKVKIPDGRIGEVYWCELRASCEEVI